MTDNDPTPDNINSGFVKVFRSMLRDSDVFWAMSKSKSYTEAWIFLLSITHHTERPAKFHVRNRLVTVRQGEFAIGQRRLSEALGWSRSQVRTFLKKCVALGKISPQAPPQQPPQAENAVSHYRICNWTHYNRRRGTVESPQDPPQRPPEDSHSIATGSPDPRRFKTDETAEENTESAIPQSGEPPAVRVPQSPKRKKSRPSAPPDPRVKVFIDWWFSDYQRRFNLKYVPDGQDFKKLKETISSLDGDGSDPVAMLQEASVPFFADAQQRDYGGHTVFWLCKQINKRLRQAKEGRLFTPEEQRELGVDVNGNAVNTGDEI